MIKSMIDTDLYKFTMQNAIMSNFLAASAEYKFINRDPSMKFNNAAFSEIEKNIHEMKHLELQPDEVRFMRDQCPYLDNGYDCNYLDYIQGYKYDPREVHLDMDNDGQLSCVIKGPWYSTILWEVPILAIISEAYFKHVDIDWNYNSQENTINRKIDQLSDMNATYSEFGTRRRRSYDTQDIVIGKFAERNPYNFFGTSNVHFAHKYNLKLIGTMAHEWFMAISGIMGNIIGANRQALDTWEYVYGNSLGIALTDTFGTDQFFREFDKHLATKFSGVRQDSGDPIAFAEKTIKHYERLGIDPLTKIIIFSDSLNVQKAKRIAGFCSGFIKCSFGIGTTFTNDFPMSKAMNIVIKLTSINGKPVVKLSDDMSKATGDITEIHKAIDAVNGERA